MRSAADAPSGGRTWTPVIGSRSLASGTPVSSTPQVTRACSAGLKATPLRKHGVSASAPGRLPVPSRRRHRTGPCVQWRGRSRAPLNERSPSTSPSYASAGVPTGMSGTGRRRCEHAVPQERCVPSCGAVLTCAQVTGRRDGGGGDAVAGDPPPWAGRSRADRRRGRDRPGQVMGDAPVCRTLAIRSMRQGLALPVVCLPKPSRSHAVLVGPASRQRSSARTVATASDGLFSARAARAARSARRAQR